MHTKKFFLPFYLWFALTLRNAVASITDYILSFTLVELKRLLKLCVAFICISYVFFNMFVLIDFVLRYRAIYGVDHTIYLLMSPARRVFFEAERSIKRGDEAKALMEFETAVEVDKKLLVGYVRLGEMYLKLKNHEKAFMYLKKAHDVNPDNSFVCRKIAEIYVSMKRYPEAISFFQKAIKVAPGNKEAYYFLGQTYEKVGEYVEAIEAYETSLTKMPVDSPMSVGAVRRMKELKKKVYP